MLTINPSNYLPDDLTVHLDRERENKRQEVIQGERTRLAGEEEKKRAKRI